MGPSFWLDGAVQGRRVNYRNLHEIKIVEKIILSLCKIWSKGGITGISLYGERFLIHKSTCKYWMEILEEGNIFLF